MLKTQGLTGLILLLSVLPASCPSEPESPDSSNYYPNLESYTAFAYNNAEPYGPKDNRNYYTVNMVQIGSGQYCNVWVDQTVWISEGDVQAIIKKYDGSIKLPITTVFGGYDGLFQDDDGKVEIFLLDIKDNYGKNGNKSFVAGYFDSRDLLSLFPSFEDDYPYGNKARILYIDAYPNTPASEQTYSTMAHELQHLINFCNSLAYRVSGKTLYIQDTWIDEGLSSAAEYIYRGGHDDARIDHFNRDPLNTISRGNNFFVWGESRPEGDETVLDDYATVYMFFQWLRLQSGGGSGIYTAIAQSDSWDYRAVTGAAAAKFDGTDKTVFSDWQKLLETWHRANYVNDSSGRDGYRGDGSLKPRVWAVPEKDYPLYPGGAVYSKYSGAVPEGDTFIKFASMTRTGSSVNPQYPYSSGDAGRLLMFNVITDLYNSDGSYRSGFIKTGRLPGAGEDKPASLPGRSVMDTHEPYAIDVWDLRGRQGRGRTADIQGLRFEK
jgi:hypothetical protein